MTNRASILDWGIGSFEEFKRQQQIFSSIFPQLTQAFLPLIPRSNQSSLSASANQTEQGTVIKWLPPEEADVLKRLKDAAVDPNGNLKNVEAFVQLLGATSTALIDHWDSLPLEMQQQLVMVTQPMLDLLTGARSNATPNVPIESTRVTTQKAPFSPRRPLRSLKITWVLIREPHKLLQHLSQMFVALLSFTRTVQQLNERDLRVAKFRRKLATSPNWNREEQVKRNQGAIAWIQARIEADKQMTEAEKSEASVEAERVRQIIDAHRDPGNKLFSND